MKYLAHGEIEGARERVFCILSWRHDFLLAPSGHPRGPDLGQEMDSAFISKDLQLMRWHALNLPPNPGQAFHPLRIVILATNLARFHTQPSSCSQRRTVPAETSRRCLAWSSRANVAQLQRVRHRPQGRGGLEEGGERPLDPGH
jgi:hypothetical protein